MTLAVQAAHLKVADEQEPEPEEEQEEEKTKKKKQAWKKTNAGPMKTKKMGEAMKLDCGA